MIRITSGLALAVMALAGLSLSQCQEKKRLRSTLDGQAACLSALAGNDLASANLRCPTEVARVHTVAGKSSVCDAALLTQNVFLIRSSCTTEVQTLLSQRDAESRRAETLSGVLRQERAGQAAAITRAESRARTETERKIRAEAVLSGAPRNGDLFVLDADRLRQLWDETATGDHP